MQKNKTFTLAQMMELHKSQPGLLFSYFMDEYCNKLLEDTPGLFKVEVYVSEAMSFIYRKSKMEVCR